MGNSIICKWPEKDYADFQLPPSVSMFCLFDEYPDNIKLDFTIEKVFDPRYSVVTLTGAGGSHSYCSYISYTDPFTINNEAIKVY